MRKQDYIANVSVPERWAAIAMLLAGTIVSAACFLLAVGVAIVGVDDMRTSPLYGCIAIFGLLTAVCGWMLIRMLRRQRAANGRTVMPEWFIQLAGIVFLIGICVIAVLGRIPWLFSEALGVALAMIGIRVLLRQSLPNEETQNRHMPRSADC
ncbi:MAG: hypothetical protein AAF394_05865 [Planctomycetota bacterium]